MRLGIRFEGRVKFGPQASDACFLGDEGRADGSLSLVAHFGLALGALDEFLSHLPRCSGASDTVTYELDVQIHNRLIPVGEDVDLMAFVPKSQPPEMFGTQQTSVRAQMSYEAEQILSASAVIVSK